MKRLAYLTIISILLVSCSKENGPTGENLYKDINGEIVIDSSVKLNANSIEGLHQQIFLPKCATSGCHDGHFEPDFRTIQSSYTTLVRAAVFKQVDPFELRVNPGDKESSWLWERITTNDAVLGKMPLYSDALPQEDLDNISSWIESGAKDMNGNTTPLPDLNPYLYGYYVADTGINPKRYDNVRFPADFTGGMVVPKNKELQIWIGVLDPETDLNALKVNQLQFSKDKNDFTNAVKVNATFVFPPIVVPNYNENGTNGIFVWKATINTSNWNGGDQVYMRYVVQDAKPKVTNLPSEYAEWYWKSRNSIIIAP